jgi:hypothetical protein
VSVAQGTVDAANGWTVSGGFTEAVGAVVAVAAGVLSISTGTLAGSITGAGKLYLAGGSSFTLEPHVAITTGTFELGVSSNGTGSTTTLGTNLTYNGLFLLDNYSGNDAVLALNGHSMTISGSSSLDAMISGPGTFTVQGTSYVADGGYSQLSMTNGAVLVDAGTMTQYQAVSLSSLLSIKSGAVWDIVQDSQIANAGSATISNAGLFEMTGGTGITYVNANVTNSATISAASGALYIEGALTNTGTLTGGTMLISGAATLDGTVDLTLLTLQGGGVIHAMLTGSGELDLHNGGHYTIDAGTVLNPATLGILDVGTQVTVEGAETVTGALDLQGGTLDLNGHFVTVKGAATLANGAVGGGGVLTLDNGTLGNGFFLFGATTLVDAGTILQTGGIALGASPTDTGTLNIGGADTYDIAGAYWLGNPNRNDTGLQTITSAGLFEMTGTGTASVFNTNFTSSGTLLVASGGVLALDGPQATLTGTITGAGGLYLGTGWTLGPREAVSIAAIENNGSGELLATATTLGNAFTSDGGGTLNLDGHRLTLTGAATLAGLIGNGGTLTLSNATDGGLTVYGDATLIDAGLITQNTGSTNLGDGSTDAVKLLVNAHTTYDVTAAGWLGNPNVNNTGTATIANSGLFENTSGGSVTVWHSIFTNTGTLSTNGTLAFVGQSAALGGTLTGSGDLVLDTTWTLNPGVVTNVASLENGGTGNLTSAYAYSGVFTNDSGAALDLHSLALTLSGADALAGAIGDGGTLTLSNATIGGLTVYGDATLVDTGKVTWTSGGFSLGGGSTDAVTMSIRGTGTFDVTVGAAWLGNPNVNDTGTSTIVNSGLFELTTTSYLDVWHSVFTSSGTLLSDGTLALIGPSATLSGRLSGSGDIDLQTTWTLANSTVSVATLENAGAGTLLSNITMTGGLADDGGSTLALAGHVLTLDGTAALNGTVSGAGTLALNGDAASIGSGASITVATLKLTGDSTLSLGGNLSYGGGFIDAASAATSTIELGGHTLVLGGGATFSASVGGGIVLGGGVLQNSGTATQSGSMTLGDGSGSGTLHAAGGVWDIIANVGIAAGGAGGDAIANAGLFEKTAGGGLSVIAAAFTNTGTVEVTTGTLEFTGGFTNSGTIIGTVTMSGGDTFITAAHA